MISLGLLTGILPSFAQEQSGCFWKDSNGKSVDLGDLCNNKNTSPPSQPPQVNSPSSNIFRIPIKRRVGGVPVIDVIFNGTQRYEMAFDTGATAIAITPEMAKDLNIKPDNKAVISTGNGNVVVQVGRVASVQVGHVVHKDLAVIILPKIPIGLLGQNFFGQHDVTIKADEIVINFRNK